MCADTGNAKKKAVCKPQPELLDSLRIWRDALEGKHKDMAYDLMNQVLDGKIKYESALALLNTIRN